MRKLVRAGSHDSSVRGRRYTLRRCSAAGFQPDVTSSSSGSGHSYPVPRPDFSNYESFSCRCSCQRTRFRRSPVARIMAHCYTATAQTTWPSVSTGSTPYFHIVPVGVYRLFYVSSRSRLQVRPQLTPASSLAGFVQIRALRWLLWDFHGAPTTGYSNGRRPVETFLRCPGQIPRFRGLPGRLCAVSVRPRFPLSRCRVVSLPGLPL